MDYGGFNTTINDTMNQYFGPLVTETDWLEEYADTLAFGSDGYGTINDLIETIDPLNRFVYTRAMQQPGDGYSVPFFRNRNVDDRQFVPLTPFDLLPAVQVIFRDVESPYDFYIQLRGGISNWVNDNFLPRDTSGTYFQYNDLAEDDPFVARVDRLIRPITLFCMRHNDILNGRPMNVFQELTSQNPPPAPAA